MIKVDIYNQEGKVVGEKELNPEIFGVEPKSELIRQAVVGLLANQRHPWAQTKVKGEIRGGGIKPWRQKGTGRARAGSIRSPLWRGGGIIFGPRKERVYDQKLNKKSKKKVLLMCLSDKVKEKKMYILDKLVMPEIKTKRINLIITSLINSDKSQNVLISLSNKDENVIKSGRNIKGVKMLPVTGLNILDLLRADYLLTTVEGVDKIQEYFGKLCFSLKEKTISRQIKKEPAKATKKSPKTKKTEKSKPKSEKKKAGGMEKTGPKKPENKESSAKRAKRTADK